MSSTPPPLESVTDAAELNEVYCTLRPSSTPGVQSRDSATAPLITWVSPLQSSISISDNDTAKEHRLKISEASCTQNPVEIDHLLKTGQVPPA